MIDLTAREGYSGATVSALVALAGVSRRSFYSCFTDKEHCFLSALGEAHGHLLARIRRAVLNEPEHAMQGAVEGLLAFARAKPTIARVVLSDCVAAGPAARELRDHAIDQIAQLVEDARDTLDSSTPVPDVPAAVLIGGSCRQLVVRLRRSAQPARSLRGEFLGWIQSYEQPLAAHRWGELGAASLPSPPFPDSSLLPTADRPEEDGFSGKDAAADTRARIILAVARLVAQQGYAATTIADIATEAGLSSRGFYRSFADKRDAFAALHEDHFRTVMGVTAGAFFSQDDWPTRIWAAGRAFVACLERNPTLSRAWFVESYAGDPVSLSRVDELVGAFTLFLQEGYQYRELSVSPTALALDAIASTIFELSYRYIRAGQTDELGAVIPRLAFLSLAPFLGPQDAYSFIDSLTVTHKPPRAG